MKFDKKKNKEKRKERKQKRRKPEQPFAKWLKPINKQIWKLAEKMASERKYGPELHNKRFKCGITQKVYCICFNDTIQFCEDCHARAWCTKEIRGIRDAD